MASPHVLHIRSLDEFGKHAAEWNDLWSHSEATFPTARAEILLLWAKRFAANQPFNAFATIRDERWTSASAFCGKKLKNVLPLAATPCNEWISCGELLVDETTDYRQDVTYLAEAIADLETPIIAFEEVIADSPHWVALQSAFAAQKAKTVVRPRYEVGRVRIQGDWSSYRESWSRKHRQNMTASLRKLEALGKVELALHSQLTAEEVENQLRRGLEIEDRGWKGTTGGSVLKTPGMPEFFLDVTKALADCGMTELAFLEVAGKPIAFCLGQSAKGVFHSAKIAYDPVYADFSPGQLLRMKLLERFFHEEGRKALDFLGPMTESHRHWRPETYAVDRMLTVPRSVLGKAFLSAYERLRR